MNDTRYNVMLERDGKVIHVILRADDYKAHNRPNQTKYGKLKYGSGKSWNVWQVKEVESR